MKALETIHINDAVGGKNKFNLSRTHLTTMEIGEIMPILHEDLIPGDTFHIGESIFSRLAPLAVPTYGQFMFKTATMFVPYYQIFEGAEAFFGGKTVSRGKTIKMPYITKFDIVSLFNVSTYATTVTNPTQSSQYDYCFSANGVTTFKKFTPKGKYIFKVLRSLGYQIPNLVSSTTDLNQAPNAGDKLNALPILCYLKAYNDFMSQSQRFDRTMLTEYLENIRLNVTQSGFYDSSTGKLSASGLATRLQDVLLQYENDYFTSCWANPNNPIGDTSANVTSISMYSSTSVPSLSINASTENTSVNLSSVVSQRALDFLNAFDRYIRRNNYAGSKDVDVVYSRFGIRPEDFKSQYAHLVNTSTSIVQVGDVTSLTDSKDSSSNSGAVLGDYAGKGIVNSDSGYKYTSDDYGMLVTLGWITVKPIYSNGFDRAVLRYNNLDWYNPEFDGLGGNPVSHGEVFTNRKNSTRDIVREDMIFGFNERYNEYKIGNKNQITGDFCIYEDMASWHFDRTDLEVLETNLLLTAQNPSFNTVNNDKNKGSFNRIFNSEADGNSYADHFYISATFNVDAYRPMKNMNEVPNLGTGDTVVPRNGNTLN